MVQSLKSVGHVRASTTCGELLATSDLNVNDFFSLDGQVALVTGGSRCLGLHAATAFLLSGAKTVFISARKAGGDEGIDQAVVRLNKLPNIKGRAIGTPANVAQVGDIERLVGEVKKHESKLDILVADAGATWGGPFEPTPDWSTQKVLDLNVRGVFNLARLFTSVLSLSGSRSHPSRVIIVSSTAGTNVRFGLLIGFGVWETLSKTK